MATKKKSSKSTGKGTSSGRKFSFEFTFTGLFALSSLFLVVLVWVFVLGILVGRGYHPERFVPQLDKVLPEKGQPQAENEVLRSEELGFFKALRRDSDSEKPQDDEKSSPPAEEASVPPAEAVAEEEQSSPPPSAQGDQRYALVYQVAAFQAEDKAVSVQKKLRNAQMDSFLAEVQREGTTWHRVLVPFTGTRQQAQDFQTRLAEAGVNNPFVYKKKTLQD